jgi:hypothetical protein
MKRIAFYAVRNDISLVLDRLEETRALRYVDLNDYKNPAPKEWYHGRDIPNLGHATCETGRNGNQYLIVGAETTVIQSPLTQRDGSKRFDIYQVNNPQSVVFVPAGEWNDVILAGEFVTMSTTPVAQALMRSAHAAIRASFRKVGNYYWVGPDALARFRSGTRLTVAEQSPREFDLGAPPQKIDEGSAAADTIAKTEHTVIDMDEIRKMFKPS